MRTVIIPQLGMEFHFIETEKDVKEFLSFIDKDFSGKDWPDCDSKCCGKYSCSCGDCPRCD